MLSELLSNPKLQADFNRQPEHDRIAFIAHAKWVASAHRYQIPPPLEQDYTVWMMLAGRGAGKQLCVDTPIPTPTGWVRNGDLKAGDKVFDERGNICSVVQAHPITMPKAAFRLTLSDGSSIDADGEHLWTTMTHRTRKQMTRRGIKRVPDDWATYRHPLIDSHHNVVGLVGADTLTTQQVRASLTHGDRRDLNHCIPTTQPLKLPHVNLPIDPYLLGSWLGDGSSKEQVIWGHVDDIGLIESHAKLLGYETILSHDNGNTWKVRVVGLSMQLRAVGVYGNKHVPSLYLRSSIDQRLALLRGLMDTDGYQNDRAAEFCNTNRKLAEAVYELAVSLGEKPVMKESRAMLYGRDCGEKYRVTWRWNRFNPFLMERKRLRLPAPSGQSFRHGHRMIVSIESIDPKPMRCITVDSHSSLYLAGEAMIPTHNTRSASEALWWWAWTHPNARCLVLAPTSNDIKFTCFEGQSGLIACIPPELVVDYNKQDHLINLVNGSSIRGISGDSYERLRGPQFHFAWCCVPGTMIELPDGVRKPIEMMAIGDVVMTRHGPRKVLSAGISRNKNDLVSIECGVTSLTVTTDHPILVGDQWIPAGDIKQGDLIWATSTSVVSTRTESSTSNTLGQSPRDGLFTIKMGTRATTTLTTLRQCLGGIINHTIHLVTRCQQSIVWRRLSAWLLCTRLSLQRVFIAARGSSLAQLARSESSAPADALRGGDTTDLCQSRVTASSAMSSTPPSRCSKSIAVNCATQGLQSEPIEITPRAVLSVERSPNSLTYNLTVEGEHEFIANGIVVHNCDELAAFQYIQEAWDMMMFGLRLGDAPRVIVTTTPRPKDLILDLVGREGGDVVIDRASTYANEANLAPTFKQQLEQYKGSKLYEQEVLGMLVDLEDGKVVSRDMFKLYPAGKAFPKFEFIVQSYDCAFSDKEYNDPTAMTTWGVFKPQDGPMSVLLIDCWAEHLTFPKLKPKVLEEWQVSYGEGREAKRPDLILVEDKAAGISLIQELRAAHLPVRGYNPGKADKMQRLQITASIFATGRVWLPESSVRKGYVKDWAEGFLSQICSFPDSTHDDYVDSATQAIRLMKDMGFLDINPELRYDDDDDYEYTKKERINPYAV